MSNTLHPNGPERRLKGSHVLTMLLAFFGVIVVADSMFIYKALTTFGGVENKNAYREGLAYNVRIAAAEQQNKLGWQSDVIVSKASNNIEVSLRDRNGAPVSGHKAVVNLGRPATNRFDNALSLAETAPGIYQAALDVAEPGTWIADLRVYADQTETDQVYQARTRLWMAP